jgi:hypothetical protein
MNEPLNQRTLAEWPDYHNNPLRLTTDEINNPTGVINEFFETYHLPDIRLCMENWLHDGLVVETIESKGHVYTHDKVIKLIEACWLIRQNNKEKLIQNTLPITTPVTEPEEVLGKPAQLIEFAEIDSLNVIIDVFQSESLHLLRDQLRDWLHVGLSADCSIYEAGEQRRQLLAFQDQLLILAEALFVIYSQNEKSIKHITEDDSPKLLNRDQIANPMQVVNTFFEKFPMAYTIRELNDWLEAGIAYAGDYPDNMSELQVLFTYRNILCLIKAANWLLSN